MGRMIDQIRASRLPSNMMQFAARGALAVPPAENIEILVYLARHNKIFGDLARMTLAGWDEKASLAAAANPETHSEVLEYMISPDNLRPKLLPPLLENPSIPVEKLAKLAISASADSIGIILNSPRARNSREVLDALQANPYVGKEMSAEIASLLLGNTAETTVEAHTEPEAATEVPSAPEVASEEIAERSAPQDSPDHSQEETEGEGGDEEVSVYLVEHAGEIAAEEGKPFQAIGGVVDLLGSDYFPVSQVVESEDSEVPPAAPAQSEPSPGPAPAKAVRVPKKPQGEPKRENTLQKIRSLDVKGRIQLALKGNKEERSILIREGTKVVALAVLDAPKITDGEVEKFASQKNVLEAVLRQIPLKRRFMKNYNVVRNLVSNPRTPLDLGLGLMKNLLAPDLKNLSGNKEVSETIRKLALKMFKQKVEAASKK